MKSLTFFAFLPALALAKVNGKCAVGGDTCICVTKTTCDYYHGTWHEKIDGKWTCPMDPSNIAGCTVKPCPNMGSNTQCQFSSSCNNELPDPVCPGGNDFVCCAGYPAP